MLRPKSGTRNEKRLPASRQGATKLRTVSMAHEVLVDLFKNRPSLGAELLSEALGVALPSYAEARGMPRPLLNFAL
jgi:hypothetical protein